MHALADGFRPFFLGAAAVAALHVVAWVAFLAGDGSMPAGMSPLVWHGHELLFGFAAAVVAGFLLTAVANWTGRRVAGPAALAVLFALWLVPRIAPWLGAHALVTQAATALFVAALAVVVAVPIVSTRNARNYQMVVILAAFAAAAVGLAATSSVRPLYAAADVLLVMMVVVGARIIPFFTGRRLPETGVVAGGTAPRAAVALTVAAVVIAFIWPDAWTARVLYAAAAVAVAGCLVRWRSIRTLGEPMLWILHLGYAWLGVVLALRAVGAEPAVALHALTVGALGCLAIGMMTRVALGHTGRPIQADAWMTAAFAFVALAALPRLAYAYVPFDAARPLLVFGGMLWSIGFAVYFARFVPVMVAPRR